MFLTVPTLQELFIIQNFLLFKTDYFWKEIPLKNIKLAKFSSECPFYSKPLLLFVSQIECFVIRWLQMNKNTVVETY